MAISRSDGSLYVGRLMRVVFLRGPTDRRRRIDGGFT